MAAWPGAIKGLQGVQSSSAVIEANHQTTLTCTGPRRRTARDRQGNMCNLSYKTLLMSLLFLHLFTVGEARPLRKRTVSEVQLMHDLGDLRRVQERREWLQMRLRAIHTGPAWGSGGEAGRTKRRLPEELPDLSDLTPEEIQHALVFLEKLLQSKRP